MIMFAPDIELRDEPFIPSGIGGHGAYWLGYFSFGNRVVEVIDQHPTLLSDSTDESEVRIILLNMSAETVESTYIAGTLFFFEYEPDIESVAAHGVGLEKLEHAMERSLGWVRKRCAGGEVGGQFEINKSVREPGTA